MSFNTYIIRTNRKKNVATLKVWLRQKDSKIFELTRISEVVEAVQESWKEEEVSPGGLGWI